MCQIVGSNFSGGLRDHWISKQVKTDSEGLLEGRVGVRGATLPANQRWAHLLFIVQISLDDRRTSMTPRPAWSTSSRHSRRPMVYIAVQNSLSPNPISYKKSTAGQTCISFYSFYRAARWCHSRPKSSVRLTVCPWRSGVIFTQVGILRK